MKWSHLLLLGLLLGFAQQNQAQRTMSDSKLLRFYEDMAERDALSEQALKLDQQDELDYWHDQENFERELGKSNFTFYLVYMKSKKEAHRKYLQECGACTVSFLQIVLGSAPIRTDLSAFSFSYFNKCCQSLSQKKDIDKCVNYNLA